MGVVEQIEAEDQEAEGDGGDTNRLVPAKVRGVHVLLLFFELLLLIHKLLNFSLFQKLSTVDLRNKVETFGGFSNRVLSQKIPRAILQKDREKYEQQDKGEKVEIQGH